MKFHITSIALLAVLQQVAGKDGLCDVESGQPNIIMDIEESRGTDISQETTPSELPIKGDPYTEIKLELVFPKGNPIFVLSEKKLQLLEPLDRDIDNLSHIVFQVTCTVRDTNKKRTIPVIVRVSDTNDNPPVFQNTPYEVSVSELSPVGTTIFTGLKATDPDAGANGLVEYRVVRGSGGERQAEERLTVADGSQHFAINLPHQGQVTVVRPLDYEKTQRYLITVVASDRARNQSSRLSATTTLTVDIKDDDDQNPSFIYQGCTLHDGSCVTPEYYSTVSSGVLAGVLSISPEKIQAVDMDTLATPIVYSFLSGSPASFRDYFEINPSTGTVRQLRPADSSLVKKFEIIVKAEEASEGRRSATAKLVVNVKPKDGSPPVLSASSREGYVQENSPVGTKVLDKEGKPIKLTVTDADIGPEDPKPSYTFELTNHLFDVDSEGNLVVASEKNLDRDPPSPGRFNFQVVAREKVGNAGSAPIILTVALMDVNDNAPRLPMIPPVSVQAGEGHRKIIQVNATDNDLGENAKVSYSIYHVSNNGMNKFTIDPQTGEIDSVGKLTAGEQYSITVQATDTGGKSGQTVVEVKVVPGPNTKTPVFKQEVYEVTISEGAPINSTVATITAEDPEHEAVSYSIISGNDLRQFAINDKTGVISVIRKLDREDLTRYELTIKAEDEGGLSTTANVNILVSDINDKNPEFIGEPYNWTVKEGLIGAHVGVVQATDADEGINANITYSVPDEVPFTINPQTGTIMTSTSLDYEKQKEYKFVVTAKDGGIEPRLATATVTVSIIDTEDEVPVFRRTLYEATVPENTADYVVTTVKADDPDTKKRITYVIKQGPLDLFAIDPNNGTIKTLQGLDFESEPEYKLVIGTLENNTTHKGATATVRIKVKDVNDVPPVFSTSPPPITLNDNVSVGTEVTKMVATDSDGTAPGNKIRYEITGRDKATKYFQINPNDGTITVKDDLRNESDNEYQIDVKASDMGEPQLSSVASVTVFVSHVAATMPPIHLGFAENSYTLQVPEDTKPGSLLKSFSVTTATSIPDIPLRCSIVEGNRDGLFQVNITKEKTCDLSLADEKQLDYEQHTEYSLKLRLDSLPDYIDQNKSIAMVKIQVLDINDNIPKFIYPTTPSVINKEKYYGAIGKEKQDIRTVLQVKAEDKDSSGLTSLEYSLVPSEYSDYFSIDPHTGSIKARKHFSNIKADRLPLRLTVLASDGKDNGHTASASVVINIIDEGDRMVLPIQKIPPEIVAEKESMLSDVLSKATGKMVGIDRVGPLETSLDNITLATDSASTDLWLYFIDPVTEKIIPVNDSWVTKIVKDDHIKTNISSEVTSVLGGGTVLPLHPPVKVRLIRTAVLALDWEVFPYAVILIAGLILVLGTVGIIYICISWQRYKAYKERVQRMYVMPRYDPVYVEPNLKEYETQVLQMSVPLDDNDSYHDLQLDFSHKNHAFSLENVSYITKDHGDNGRHSPTNSEAATTTRASTLGRHRNNLHDGTVNLSYERSDDEIGHNSSPTNDNITFREKKDYSHLGFNYLMDRSSIETTTEL